MSISEHPLQLSPRKRSAPEPPQQPERQPIVNLIRQLARPRPHRIDPMQVFPARKRTAHQHIPKLSPCDIISVHDFPLRPNRPHLRAQRNPRAVPDPAHVSRHLHALPRRTQPAKRPGPFVPGKHFRRGSLDSHHAFKNRISHAPPGLSASDKHPSKISLQPKPSPTFSATQKADRTPHRVWTAGQIFCAFSACRKIKPKSPRVQPPRAILRWPGSHSRGLGSPPDPTVSIAPHFLPATPCVDFSPAKSRDAGENPSKAS